ncbi:hypothetical protein, partial [Pseudoflavonifractor sp. AF19-9AC]|uniref:hypothetical protein n=1 Tax=Pseudoflavonifractor sp. AF19-9AC TaxID=2292244 RepID=UPI001A9ADBDF
MSFCPLSPAPPHAFLKESVAKNFAGNFVSLLRSWAKALVNETVSLAFGFFPFLGAAQGRPLQNGVR